MNNLGLRLLVLIVFVSLPVGAEVRYFTLRIAKKSSPQDYRLVVSSLDPLQYVGYFPVAADEVVTYDNTWRCPDRTGDFRRPCPNPRAPASESSEGPENKP